MFSDSKIKPTMSLTQYMIYQGNAFRTFSEFNVPANNGEFYISILNGANLVHLFYRQINSTQPKLRYEVRTGATITGYVGQPIPIRNMNAKSSQISTNIARVCTVSSIGELTDIQLLGGGELSGSRAMGDEEIEPDDLKILPSNTEFLIRCVNPANDIAKCLLYLKWFETADY